MKLLTKYSWLNLMVMVAIFLASSLVIFKFTQVILIRERNADLAGVENTIRMYVKKFDSLPQASPLDEENIKYVLNGNQIAERKIAVTQMFSLRENKMHNFIKLDFPLWANGTWYKVSVAKPLEGLHHLSNALLTISILTILVFILISILLNNLLLRRLWRPFYNSMHLMRNFKLGEIGPLVFPITTTSEFLFMNESLALATGKAKQDYLLLKEFTENASHEIQTPLSIIRSKLDLLIQEEELSQKQSELVREAYRSIKKLSRLNQSLLLLAKIENQQFEYIQLVDLKEKVKGKIEEFRELWQNNNIKANVDLKESQMQINPELLDILLNNLFSNAVNHNAIGGSISIELKNSEFTIINSSHSDALDEKKIFSRFYKTSVHNNGNGLGLSIIKQISRVSRIRLNYKYAGQLHFFSISW